LLLFAFDIFGFKAIKIVLQNQFSLQIEQALGAELAELAIY
jgi:hypothetical protein